MERWFGAAVDKLLEANAWYWWIADFLGDESRWI